MIHVVRNQNTVVKSAIVEINSASTEVSKWYAELNEKQMKLEANIKTLINSTYTLALTNRIFSILSALMTQYAYEAQTLNAIITGARTCVLHPSLVTSRELAAQLVDMKLNLSIGTLPSEIHELTSIIKMVVLL